MKKILIIDDEPNSVEPIKMLFEDEGFEPKIIGSHTGLFQEIDGFKPDLILLDIMLRGTDGRYVCELLKSTTRTQEIPVVLISGSISYSAVAENKLSADGYLQKPFDLDAVMEKVRALIR